MHEEVTPEFCTHKMSVTEKWVSAASCLLDHIQKNISSTVQEWKVLNFPRFLLDIFLLGDVKAEMTNVIG